MIDSQTRRSLRLDVDRALITSTVLAYATAIDRRHYDLLASVVTDPVLIDFSSYDPDRSPALLARADWINGLRGQLGGLDATVHAITAPRILVRGDQATCVSNIHADHVLATDGTFTLIGHYTDTLVRTEIGWSISEKFITIEAEIGDRAVMTKARERGTALLGR